MGHRGEKALKDLEPRLAAIPEEAGKRPHADPMASATTALLVSDFLTNAGLLNDRELGTIARAIAGLVSELGGEYLSDAKSVPGDLLQRAQNVRNKAVAGLEQALPDDDSLKTWLDAVRLGAGVVDLVYDLRTLTEIHGRWSSKLPEGMAKLPATMSSNADAIEFALRAGETAEHHKARANIARLWTMFVPAYEAAHAVAPPDRKLPSLGLIAGHKRAKRKPAAVLNAAPHRVAPNTSPPLPRMPQVAAVEIKDLVQNEPPPPPPVSAAATQSASFAEARREPRQIIEIEVAVAADAKEYLGITENLSSGGVFVATYSLRPIGSKVAVELAIPGGEPFAIDGVVRWLRHTSGENWPGIGVQFETVSAEQDARIRKFLATREPIFYGG